MKIFTLILILGLTDCQGDSNRAEIVGRFQRQEIAKTYQSGPIKITELKSVYFLVCKLKGRVITNQVDSLVWSQSFPGKIVRLEE